jgi:hypothetical protein
MSYLLDANVFIQAKNLHYGMDFAPGFWEWIVQAHDGATALSIEKVGDELKAGGDELATWAAAQPTTFFKPADASDAAALTTVTQWVTSQGYEPAAVSTFLQVADLYLVAQALAGGYTVVTHEVFSPSLKKIKIPNVCLGVGVKHVTTYEMLRSEQARLVLGSAP